MAKYQVNWEYSEWFEYEGFSTQYVLYKYELMDRILTEDEAKEILLNTFCEDGFSCDGLRWNICFYNEHDDLCLDDPFEELIFWIYPEDLE